MKKVHVFEQKGADGGVYLIERSVKVSAIIDDLSILPSDWYSIQDILPFVFDLEGIPFVTSVTTENFENKACILYIRDGVYKIVERL